MTMYARVEQGVVRELVETDQPIEDLYHPDLFWVDARDMPGVCPGWIVTRDGFSPPEPEKVAAATPTIDIAELLSRVNELGEHVRMLTLGTTTQHSSGV